MSINVLMLRLVASVELGFCYLDSLIDPRLMEIDIKMEENEATKSTRNRFSATGRNFVEKVRVCNGQASKYYSGKSPANELPRRLWRGKSGSCDVSCEGFLQ